MGGRRQDLATIVPAVRADIGALYRLGGLETTPRCRHPRCRGENRLPTRGGGLPSEEDTGPRSELAPGAGETMVGPGNRPPADTYMLAASRFLSAMKRWYQNTSTGLAMNIDE